MMLSLTPNDLIHSDWKLKKFVFKYKAGDSFQLTDGRKVSLEYTEENEQILLSKNTTQYRKMMFTDASNKIRKYKLINFAKNKEFGEFEKERVFVTDKETRMAASVTDELTAIMSETGENFVPISIGNNVLPVRKLVRVTGAKATMAILSETNQEIGWILQIPNNSITSFLPWDMMTNEEIAYHPETQQFVSKIMKIYPDGINPRSVIAWRIKDDSLKKKTVYGPDYEVYAQRSRNNVDLVVQGNIKIAKSGLYHTFKGMYTYENGNPVLGVYEPTIVCTYKEGSNQFGVPNGQFVVQARESERVTEWIS